MRRPTKKEMSEYFLLGKEIHVLESALHKLEGREFRSSRLTGMPRGSGVSDPVANLASQVADIKAEIVHRKALSISARHKIEKYINAIEDPEMRILVRMRNIDGLTFQQIAMRIGMHQQPYYVNLYNRFFQE